MAEIDSRGSAVHPIGWSFLGAGAAFWIWPLSGFSSAGFITWLALYEATTVILVGLFAATLAGLIIDFATAPVELLLLRVTGLQSRNPSSAQWAAAWRARWKYGPADAELRRYEGVASAARAYACHSLLAGFAWWGTLGTPAAWWSLMLGLAATILFGWMWYRSTSQIFLVVRSAHSWEALST